MRCMSFASLMLVLVLGRNTFAQEAPAPAPAAPTADAPPSKEDEEKAKKEKKEKEEKEKKEKKEKELTKALSSVKVDGKAVTFADTFVPYLVGLGNVTAYKPSQFGTWAYMVPRARFGVEAHCGTYTGYIGAQDGFAVFGSTETGSGLGLKTARTVIYVPVDDFGTYGVPEILLGTDTGNGIAYTGEGPGLYLVQATK